MAQRAATTTTPWPDCHRTATSTMWGHRGLSAIRKLADHRVKSLTTGYTAAPSRDRRVRSPPVADQYARGRIALSARLHPEQILLPCSPAAWPGSSPDSTEGAAGCPGLARCHVRAGELRWGGRRNLGAASPPCRHPIGKSTTLLSAPAGERLRRPSAKREDTRRPSHFDIGCHWSGACATNVIADRVRGPLLLDEGARGFILRRRQAGSRHARRNRPRPAAG